MQSIYVTHAYIVSLALKMKCIALCVTFIVRIQEHSKEFHSNTIYEKKVVCFNVVILFQTYVLKFMSFTQVGCRKLTIESGVHSIYRDTKIIQLWYCILTLTTGSTFQLWYAF